MNINIQEEIDRIENLRFAKLLEFERNVLMLLPIWIKDLINKLNSGKEF